LESGNIQLFCVDSVDEESLYNKQVPPAGRCIRNTQYENYIIHEFLPFLRQRNHNFDLLMLTGCSFGAYRAINMAFRNPELVRRVVAMGGKYEIRHLMDGFYEDTVYFNSPIDFLPGLTEERYLQPLRNSMEIVLLTGENDICRESTVELSRILVDKQIPHILDIWGEGAGHDWPWWRQMIVKYI
jgi:esterase/lipase superfamily enzyme